MNNWNEKAAAYAAMQDLISLQGQLHEIRYSETSRSLRHFKLKNVISELERVQKDLVSAERNLREEIEKDLYGKQEPNPVPETGEGGGKDEP